MEWYINDEIEYLHRVISGTMGYSVSGNLISNRLFRLGVISLFHQINDDLEELKNQLESSVILEGVSIDFDTFLDEKYWKDNLLFVDEKHILKSSIGFDIENASYQYQINEIIDYLPNGVEGYNVTQNLIDTFKTSLNQLCDRKKLGSREILFGLHAGLFIMLNLLREIKQQVEHPKPHQYVKVWEEIYDESYWESVRKEYLEWKEENVDYTFEDLLLRQKYEIFRLLKSKFFRFYNSITGADVKKRSLIITEDDLPVGETVSEELPAECAKFQKFFEWKGKYVLSLNYEKLGQYIYKYYRKLDYPDIDTIVRFDMMMDLIHKDMVVMKIQLKPYLKGYEEEKVKDLLNECADILNTCQKHLAPGINENFLQAYMEKLLFSKDMRCEARKKLSGQSRNTYICEIVAVLKNFKIFKLECDKYDLAKSLSEKITKVQLDTLKKNIERAYNTNDGTLYRWTQNIIENLKKETSNPLARII